MERHTLYIIYFRESFWLLVATFGQMLWAAVVVLICSDRLLFGEMHPTGFALYSLLCVADFLLLPLILAQATKALYQAKEKPDDQCNNSQAK